MSSNNPAGVILETIGGTLAYVLMVPVAVLAGMWLMVSWSGGELVAVREVMPLLFVATFLWPFSLHLIVAWAATLALVVWGYRSDSMESRGASLAAMTAVWVLTFLM